MKILYDTFGPVQTNGYLIYDENSKQAVIIDVPLDSKNFFKSKIKELDLELEQIWLTHSHWDHTGDLVRLKNELESDGLVNKENIPVFIHQEDEYRLIDPLNYIGFPIQLDLNPYQADSYLNHGDLLQIGSFEFEVLHCPGHTEGSVIFVCHNLNIAIVGDVLFNGSIGRTDLPGGNHGQMMLTLKEQILPLPNEMEVYSGHGPKTTIGFEKQFNPYLLDLI